ncbi:TetR/AcrR family transcriptional regulator [Pararobbsia silviterrae]|uniref:TetR/AcrR family transcriptional regulator n=1 Tax=Pararobbsia silviterrae TaxID=1792498 RepID=A0A494XM88_9BURK|nr:TetR/AcrR family transcriptional regulator [Pararobbsia silviterrae]RKP51800.1 TetR/AcrR family transcriptional regulator [Pararobbsia silviterrae]
METRTVREQLVEYAQTLIMLRGFNGFSYRDLSELVGVKTSSIHYYFPSKDDLILEAVNTYSSETLAEMYAMDSSLPADVRLDRYTRLFGKVLGDGDQICLCGMLAADIASLPENVKQAVQSFFRSNETWLGKLLAEGKRQGTLVDTGKPEVAGRVLYSAFQGAVLASRLFGVRSRLEEVTAAYKVR